MCRFDEIDSTNRWVAEQARSGVPAGLVAVADHQTAGRGRLGRTWTAPPGSSLLMSILLRPELPPDRLHLVTENNEQKRAAGTVLDEAGVRIVAEKPVQFSLEDVFISLIESRRSEIPL